MAGDNPLIPLLEMWQRHPEAVKDLISNPLAAAVEALKQANANDDYREVEAATQLLEFIACDYYGDE